jgi:phosphonate transport system substrate-binding protein
MEKKTGLKVKSFYAPDYAGVIEAMRFNKVQVAWYGNKSAMEAVDRANGEVFAQVMYADGTYGYHGLLITHKDSPYKTLDDVFKNAASPSTSASATRIPPRVSWCPRSISSRSERRRPSHGLQDRAQRQPRRQPAGRAGRQVDVATNNTEDYRQARRPPSPSWRARSACSGRAR